MMYHLKWITKHCGIGTATAELAGMVWNGRFTFRQKNKIYRLKSARGAFRVVPSRLYMTMYFTILTPRNTAHIVNRFHIPFETLYNFKGV